MGRVLVEQFFQDRSVIEGIEVGALHSPYPNRNPNVHIRYVDRMTVPDLRKHYPELNGYNLVVPNIIDDGEILQSIENNSLDFIIANHFLEHCENLFRTVENHIKKVKKGGILYYYVPNKDFTFDKKRDLTTIEHLMDEYQNGHEKNRKSHFEDWCVNVGCPSTLEELMEQNYSIHFHVWDEPRFKQIVEHMERMFDVKTELYSTNGNEIGLILRKQ